MWPTTEKKGLREGLGVANYREGFGEGWYSGRTNKLKITFSVVKKLYF